MAAEIEVFCAYDEMVEIGELLPHPENTNRHPEKQIAALARMIRENGWRAPITVSRLSGYIVRGHGRLEAARRLRCVRVPVDYQEYDNPTDEIVDLIGDNRLSEMSSMDERALAAILRELETDGADLDMMGFDEKHTARLYALLESGEGPPEPEVPFSAELHEASNYVVLVFANDVDWLQAQTVLDLGPARALDSRPGFEKKGIGRVLNGPDTLRALLG